MTLRDRPSVPEIVEAVQELQDRLATITPPGPSDAGSGGGQEGTVFAGRQLDLERRQPDRQWNCIVTDRQNDGGVGTLSDPTAPGTSVVYKVKPLATGVETDWLTPVRYFDYQTIGYVPAAVGAKARLTRFPVGDGTFEVFLELLEPEVIKGKTCS